MIWNLMNVYIVSGTNNADLCWISKQNKKKEGQLKLQFLTVNGVVLFYDIFNWFAYLHAKNA